MIIFHHFSPFIPIKQCLRYRKEGNVGIVNNKDDFKLIYLNDTALTIFELIDGKKTIEEIFNLLLQEYDVEEEILKSDLINVIRDFQWRKIIHLKYINN